MLAAVYDRLGASDVIAVREVDRPEPGPGEVRVRLRVSGINPTDWKRRAGLGGVEVPEGGQIPNHDGSGVIDAVGEGVDSGRIGERVWVFLAAAEQRWGTAAQWTVLPAERAVALPDGISDDLGACLGVPALTAHRCLFADGPIDGRNVLVAGGAGAVGHAAVALARWAGAHVVATVSSEAKAEIARAAGAHETVNYREPDAAQRIRAAAPGGVDRVVEVDLRANLELDLAVAGERAVITVYADGGVDPAIPVRTLMVSNIVLRFMLLYTVGSDALKAGVEDVTQALRDGALSAPPLHRFALQDTARAHDAVEQGAVGKVLVDIP